MDQSQSPICGRRTHLHPARSILAEAATAHQLFPSFCYWKTLLLTCVVMTFVAGSATAQNAPCVPNINYPCVYVANAGSNTVSVINATTDKVIGIPIAVGTSPMGLAITPDNKSVYVANNGSDTVSVIDTTTNSVIASVSLRGSPTQGAITPDGTLAYIVEPLSDLGTTFIEIIDTKTNLLIPVFFTSPGVTNPTAIAFNIDGKFAYVADTCTVSGIPEACMDVIDTTKDQVVNAIPISSTIPQLAASVAVTPGGALICMSVDDPNAQLEVACVSSSNFNNISITPIEPTAVASDYGFAVTSNGLLYAAEPSDSAVAVLDTNTVPPSLKNTINVGNSPAGVTVTPDGAFVYVTNANDSTVSIIKTATNSVSTTLSGFSNPQGVAAMPSIPATILTQPANQTINFGGTATLSVAASGTAPLSYQWYSGKSGDVTNPIPGATGTSISIGLLPAGASFWVQVSNVVGSVNSNTATITVRPPPAPTITTQPVSQTIDVGQTATLTLVAAAPAPLTINAQWYQGESGDTSKPIAGANGSSFTTPALTSTTSYWVQVSDEGGSVNSNTAIVTVIEPPLTISPGQSTQVAVLVTSPTGSPVQVGFACTIVTDPNGQNPRLALDLGITCHSNPLTITLSKVPQSVTIVVNTTGPASALLVPGRGNRTWFCALWMPLLAITLGGGLAAPRSARGGAFRSVAPAALVVLLLLFASCGGGFTVPSVAATPAGSYQLTIVDYPAQGPSSGFVQTSLIVPLTVI